jgi:hypothetical protein
MHRDLTPLTAGEPKHPAVSLPCQEGGLSHFRLRMPRSHLSEESWESRRRQMMRTLRKTVAWPLSWTHATTRLTFDTREPVRAVQPVRSLRGLQAAAIAPSLTATARTTVPDTRRPFPRSRAASQTASTILLNL